MAQQIAQQLLTGEFELHELSPEASPRRYFRVTGEDLLLVTSEQPPAIECQELLNSCGICSPAYGKCTDGGYLIEDCADTHLSHQPDANNYRMLIEDWHKFSRCQLPARHPNAGLALDAALFKRELQQFVNSYLTEFKQLQFDTDERQQLEDLCDSLANDAAHGPQCLQQQYYVVRQASTSDLDRLSRYAEWSDFL